MKKRYCVFVISFVLALTACDTSAPPGVGGQVGVDTTQPDSGNSGGGNDTNPDNGSGSTGGGSSGGSGGTGGGGSSGGSGGTGGGGSSGGSGGTGGGSGSGTTTPTPPVILDTSNIFPTPGQAQADSRTSRTIDISLPDTLVWTRYQICSSATSCNPPLAEGNGSGNQLSLQIGGSTGSTRMSSSGVSLSTLLSMSQNGTQIRFYNGDGDNPVATLTLDQTAANGFITAINNSIQYFKSGFSTAGDFFGAKVDISQNGKTIVIGALNSATTASTPANPLGTEGQTQAGAVFVFTDLPPTPASANVQASPGGWKQTAVIKFSETESENVDGGLFGKDVEISDDGNTLAIAMPGNSNPGSGAINGSSIPTGSTVSSSGAVLIYTKNSDTNTWSRQAFLKPRVATPNTFFSDGSIALSGDGNWLAVTSLPRNSVSNAETNGITIFFRENATWALLGTENIKPLGMKADGSDLVGKLPGTMAFSANGEFLAVGTPQNDSGTLMPAETGSTNSGGVYAFRRNGTSSNATYAEQIFIKAADKADQSNTNTLDIKSNSQFGISVDLSANGEVLAVGTGDPDGGANTFPSAEKVYIFDYVAPTGNAQAQWRARYTNANSIKPPANSTNSSSFGLFVKLNDAANKLAIFTLNARRALGVTTTEATGEVIQNTGLDDSGSGSVSLYSLSDTSATRDFHFQPTRPPTEEKNYSRFGQMLALSGGSSASKSNPLVLVAATAVESSEARGINMENDASSTQAQSGAAWVLNVE